MSTTNRPADGIITSGRGEGDYIYCFAEIYPVRLKYNKLILKDLTFVSQPGLYSSDGTYLFNGPEANTRFDSFTPQTVSRIDILASTTTGPSASNFVTGTLIGGVALGAAAAMAPMGSTHTVKVTWRDDLGSKESIITFNNSTGFQNFIGKLGTLINQPNEARQGLSSPAISSPAFSSADEILKFKKLMDEGIITQEEFDAKKKQLLGIETTVVNSSETNNPEYYSVMVTSFDDCKMVVTVCYLQYKHCGMDEAKRIIDRATLPFEIVGTTSKSEAEEVAKKFSSAGAPVEIRQPKSDGGFVVTTFKNGYAIDENQPKVEAIDLEAKHKDPEVGDEIYFGTNNGQRMRCKVLEKQDRKVLVITTDIICNKQYHSTQENITWRECTLREWLNSSFINGYFTQDERDRILSWKINNKSNPEYKTSGGVFTTDKVFCLSIDEAKSLFANDQERALGFWWLRSPGVCPTNAAAVVRNGEVHLHGFGVTQTSIGVRPAFWLDLTTPEERKEAAESAKKRFDAYWEAHADERKTLEEEQKALEDQINSLNASCNEKVEALEKEIAAIPGKDEIEKLDARMKKLSEDYAALGIFKGKEKKELQDQYVQAEADKKAIQKKMAEAKAALEENISATKKDTQGKISALQRRNKSIDTELNMPR